MSELSVFIEPFVPPAKEMEALRSLTDEERARIALASFGDYDLVYSIGDQRYGYYPTNLLSVMDDVQDEIDNINSNSSHFIKRAGYPILYADDRGSKLDLFDPADESTGYDKKKRIGSVKKDLFLRILIQLNSSLFKLAGL